MTTVTRHALRVYAALSGLKSETGGDVLDALIPFMEPILDLMNGKIFDPGLLALGVQRLYGWRFNRDIAEQFAGRLLSKGYLKKATPNVFVVQFQSNNSPDEGEIEIKAILERAIAEFEQFPPKVTDLFRFSLTRAELKEILIRFLVSLDSYTEEAFVQQIERMKLDIEKRSLLDQLEEGGDPLTPENRYLCARFVKHLVNDKPEFIPHLARLASIGLLTEVVQDFIKPTSPVKKSDLILVLDAPVALNLLGLSGREAQSDIRNVVESLRAIGCGVIVLPVSCDEMSRNLSSMLSLPPLDRHGPTHDAMRKREVNEDFVRSAMKNPELALESHGVTVRPIDLESHPHSLRFFAANMFEEFFSGITWKQGSIDAREHDAVCAALTIRLRAGAKSSDLLASKFVFVTTNPIFERYAREFSRAHRLINERQTPPVILQRELATTAWLRTGLIAAAGDVGKEIPRSHLIASCERVLRARKEVVKAVHDKLREFAPDKLAQYELLLTDHRSVQRLMDETLGEERLVTAESAGKLLEEMRLATARELRDELDRKFRQQAQRHGAQTKALREQAEAAVLAERQAKSAAIEEKQHEIESKSKLLASTSEERDSYRNAVTSQKAREVEGVTALISGIDRFSRNLEKVLVIAVLILVGVAIYGATLGGANHYLVWGAGVVFMLIGAYYTVQDIRQKPKLGFASILNQAARRKLRAGLKSMGLEPERFESAIEVTSGRVQWNEAARTALVALPGPGPVPSQGAGHVEGSDLAA